MKRKKELSEYGKIKQEMGVYVFHALNSLFDDLSWLSFSKEKILEEIKDVDLRRCRGIGIKKEKMIYDYLRGASPPAPIIKRKIFKLFGRRITITIKKL